jgi:hypothetical protein
MKPSERIIQIAKDLAAKDAKTSSSTIGWEQLDDLGQMMLVLNSEAYFVAALIQYLDESAKILQ